MGMAWKKTFMILVWAGLLAMWPLVSQAADLYVSPSGSDASGNGSVAAPFATIQHVLDNVAVSGDSLVLRAGTYNESIRIRNPNITIRSETGEWAKIQAGMTDEDEETAAVLFDVDSDGSALERVEVAGGYYYGIMFFTKWDWGDPTDRSGASNIAISDCIIHDTGGACIKITPGCDDITIQRCEIYNSGRLMPDSAEAIDNVNGDRMTVRNCNIHDITATGLYAKGGATGAVIEGCVVQNCGDAGILVGFDTSPEWFDLTVNPEYYENIDGTVRNCLVINTRYSGIGMYAAKNAKVYNNTLVNVAQAGHSGLYFGLTYQDWEDEAGRPPSINPALYNNIVVTASANPAGVAIRYSDDLGGMSALSGMPAMGNNRYYGQGQAIYFEDMRPASEFTGDLAAWQAHVSGDAASTEGDPGFVDLAAGDYHLAASSPCIDAGTPAGAPATDLEGALRPQGAGYDLGAYEYGQPGTAVNPGVFLTANGSDGPVVLPSGAALTLYLSLDPGSYGLAAADWWLVSMGPSGVLSSFDAASLAFVPGLAPTLQTGLFLFSDIPIPLTGLAAGSHVFYFGVDLTMNSQLDTGVLFHDHLVVTVQ